VKKFFFITKNVFAFLIIFGFWPFLCPSLFAENSDLQESSPKSSASVPAAVRSTPVQDFYDRKTGKVEAVADSLEYQKDSKKLIARGNAVITYQNYKLLADYAEVESDANQAYAKGHVIVFKNDTPTVRGEEVYYDFGKHTGNFPNGRAISRSEPFSAPWYARGEQIRQIREGVNKIKNGGVTTCNLDKPHYEIRSKKATLYTGEKLIMYNATIYVLGKPVFWFPVIDIPLNWPNIPVQATAGYSSEYGAYIELLKGVTFNKHLWGKAHIDWRSKRGFGAGWDQYYEFGKYAKGSIKIYGTQDKKAPTPGYKPPGSSTEVNPYDQREDRNRGRITWKHRTDIDDNTNILLRYHRAADEYFLQDFFENEYRANVQPTSFLTANHNTERYGAMIHLEKKMNSYETMVERLPEIRLDWKNQPVVKELIYNESRVQFDNLSEFPLSRNDFDHTALRTDAYSRFFMPLRWNDFSFTPFAGYRGTEYSRQLTTDASVYRNVMEYGTDLRTHFYKTLDVSFNKIGIEVNQLRHIAEPSVVFKGTSSSLSSYHVNHFDTTDKIDDASQVILGLENRLQTKRVVSGKNQRVDIVSFNTFLHFEISPEDANVGGNKFTLSENELTLRPYEWLQYQARATFDFSRTYMSYIKFWNHDIAIRTGKWRFLFGQRYVHDYYDWYTDQDISTSHEFVFDLQYRLNHLWAVGGYIRWDTASNSYNEWQVSASRDLHDFVLDFGYSVRNSLIDSNNNTLFFTFRMKALPNLALSGGNGRATFSEPRIGDTVAGANHEGGRFSSIMDESWYNPRASQF